jgi:membrane-associated phospholipid phosphatase
LIRKLTLIAILIFVSSQASQSDSTFTLKNKKPPKPTIWDDLGYDIKAYAFDWGSFLIYPFTMSGKDALIGGTVIGGTALISLIDDDFRDIASHEGRSTYNHDFWDIPTFYGYVQYPSILGGAMYAVGLFARENWIRKTGRMLLQSLTYGGTVTMGLRYVLGRHRPFSSEKNQYEFSWFESNGDLQSFPSGHTVVAFSTSTILAEQIDTWWARVVLYSFAALTGYARIYNDQHWISDVVFGAALGFGSSMFVLKMERDREKEAKKKIKSKGGGFSFYPGINGIRISYGF